MYAYVCMHTYKSRWAIFVAVPALIANAERLIDFQILPLRLRLDPAEDTAASGIWANKIINVLGVGQHPAAAPQTPPAVQIYHSAQGADKDELKAGPTR